LTTIVLKILGCSPNFNVPGRPEQPGLCERLIETLKNMINKVAAENPRSWHKHLGFVLWALREVPNYTAGVPLWLLAFGRLPRGPLAVLKDTMVGKTELPLNLGKSTTEYLEELRKNLELAQHYAASHAHRAQQQYVHHYNLRTREKSFEVGQKILVLVPDSTSSKLFSRWQGPGVIKEKRSAYYYIVEINGAVKHLHADKIRAYHIDVDEIICDTVTTGHVQSKANHCSVIYEADHYFGEIGVINDEKVKDQGQIELLPSQNIDTESLSHLTQEQQARLLAVLDKYPECFSDSPEFCDLIQHEIHVSDDFRPKRLRSYRVPENLKPMVKNQIQELLKLGIIKPSKSEMGSPIVCVLKGKDGKDRVRIAVDSRLQIFK